MLLFGLAPRAKQCEYSCNSIYQQNCNRGIVLALYTLTRFFAALAYLANLLLVHQITKKEIDYYYSFLLDEAF